MEVKNDILWRVYLGFIGIVVLSLCIFGRAVYIQQFQGSYWRSKSDSLHTRLMPMQAERGTIFSEDGDMLSTSVPYFDIYIDFGADGLREKNGRRFTQYVDSLSMALAGFFADKKASAYKKELQAGYRKKDRYYELKKNLTFEQYKTLRSFPLVNQGRNKSGFIAEVRNKRLNPFGLLANRTIGLSRDYTNASGKLVSQNVGLERTYDSLLKGDKGQRLVRFISGGAFIPVEGSEIEPQNGKDIITTIDVNTQDIAENALMKMMLENEADHGTCIVMETATGKIKAMANLGKRPDGGYWEDYNYALRATEPGSTIKLATLLAVLSEGKATINDPVQVGATGSDYVGVRTVTDAERQPKPVETIKECFAHSSNVGMSRIAYNNFATQPDKFLQYLHKYHFDARTGIDLVGEERPVLPKIKRNTEGLHAMVTMSFGYAIEVTPLQTLTLYNAIANNGKMVKPWLVNRIEDNGLIIKSFEPEVVEENIATPAVIHAAQECMLAVTKEGTGKLVFKDAPYNAGGKTGTAHVAGKGLGYDDGVYQASFVGYFPFEHPQYSCIVVIKTKPHPEKHMGGLVAAPVFREVADKLYAIKNSSSADFTGAMKKDSSGFYYAGAATDVKQVLQELNIAYVDSAASQPWTSLYSTDGSPILTTRPMAKNTMPNVKGLGLKDALYLLEGMHMKVMAKGRGRVTLQSIDAGKPVTKNQLIKLELN
ncbi:MAG TPA: penicillin-binding protein [Chitinophagaceae bacterium]|nr:penicillin-binding protein [Chitinophagaceae bacterium]